MKATRTKVILYQHAEFLKPTSKNLQEHVESARVTRKLASQREQKLGEGNDHVRVWNSQSKRGLLTCGMFHSYETGMSQMILAMKDGAEEYPVVTAPPPQTKDSKHTEFNEGLLFFGIHKNHVLVVQSTSLRARVFEEYLNWFLQDATTEIGKDNRLELRDPTPKKILKQRKVDPLKSIILTPNLHTQVVGQPAASARKSKDLQMKLNKEDWHPLRDLLRTMGADVPDELKLEGDFKPELVQVNIELKWLGRKKDRAETPMLDTILRAFRDVDNPPIKAVTVSGETIEGEELRLRKPESFQVDGKIPLPGDVYEKMSKYLAELLQRGDIPVE